MFDLGDLLVSGGILFSIGFAAGFAFMHHKLTEKVEFPVSGSINVLKQDAVKLKPYGKKDKRTPKFNDDNAFVDKQNDQ